MSNIWQGIFVAMVTPMRSNGEIDYAMLEQLTEGLVDAGVQGLIPLGSTGEFYALSVDERERVAGTVIQSVSGRVPVVVGANGGSTRDIISLCQMSQSQGASGVLLAPPYYSLPTETELMQHFENVANSINIPIMLYNYPARTGIDLKPEMVARLSEIDGIDYIKESSGDASRITDIMSRCGDRMTTFCGSDTLALETVVVGAKGWVTGVANFLPGQLASLFKLIERGLIDDARQLYFILLPVLRLAENSGQYTQVVKAACKVFGRDVGPPRTPLAEIESRLSGELTATLTRALEDIGALGSTASTT